MFKPVYTTTDANPPHTSSTHLHTSSTPPHATQVIVDLELAVRELLLQYYHENGKQKPKARGTYGGGERGTGG